MLIPKLLTDLPPNSDLFNCVGPDEASLGTTAHGQVTRQGHVRSKRISRQHVHGRSKQISRPCRHLAAANASRGNHV